MPLDMVTVCTYPYHAEPGFPKGLKREQLLHSYLGHQDTAFKHEVLWDEDKHLANLLGPENCLSLRIGVERSYELRQNGEILHYVSSTGDLEKICQTIFTASYKLPAHYVAQHLAKMRDFHNRIVFARKRNETIQVSYRIEWLPEKTLAMLRERDLAGLLKLCRGSRRFLRLF